jgi:hypothetical protein
MGIPIPLICILIGSVLELEFHALQVLQAAEGSDVCWFTDHYTQLQVQRLGQLMQLQLLPQSRQGLSVCELLRPIVAVELHILPLQLCQCGCTQQLRGQLHSKLAAAQPQLLQLRQDRSRSINTLAAIADCAAATAALAGLSQQGAEPHPAGCQLNS